MAVLSDALRAAIWRGLMRWLSDRREGVGAITKADLRAAIDAVDEWVDANASALNTAIPQPARAQLTAAQKALLLAIVALVRYDPSVAARLFNTE